MNINEFIGSLPVYSGETNGSNGNTGGSNGNMNGSNGNMNGSNGNMNGSNQNMCSIAGCCFNTPTSAFPAETPVGMMYVPFQRWEYVYEPQVGFERGTIFEALDKPFLGERPV